MNIRIKVVNYNICTDTVELTLVDIAAVES